MAGASARTGGAAGAQPPAPSVPVTCSCSYQAWPGHLPPKHWIQVNPSLPPWGPISPSRETQVPAAQSLAEACGSSLDVIPGGDQGEMTSHNTPSRPLVETSVGFYRKPAPALTCFHACLRHFAACSFLSPLLGASSAPSGSPVCRCTRHPGLDNRGPWSHGAPE